MRKIVYSSELRDVKDKSFRVTHPYHPLRDREFELASYTFCWGEARVIFYRDAGQLCSLPAAWTSVGAPDPFVAVSAGRSAFRLIDLLELSRVLREAACNANKVNV